MYTLLNMRGSIVYYYANYYANHDIKITHQ